MAKNTIKSILLADGVRTLMCVAAMVFALNFNIFSQSTRPLHALPRAPRTQSTGSELPDSIPLGSPLTGPSEVVEDEISYDGDHLSITPVDTIPVIIPDSLNVYLASGTQKEDEWVRREVDFSPDPNRAVWFSALFPGLGQVYNRRYWKLPIIVGGYLGLAYATTWNNTMLADYTKAYADIMDNDPSTNSYMDFFNSTIREEDLDKTWLTNVLKSRKNYFRRNRDLCIISMIGVYLLAMLDAYVDASLSHFDITPDLSMNVSPALFQDARNKLPSVGLQWALSF